MRVAGKLIRKSLKTDVLSVATLRSTDFDKQKRRRAQSREFDTQNLCAPPTHTPADAATTSPAKAREILTHAAKPGMPYHVTNACGADGVQEKQLKLAVFFSRVHTELLMRNDPYINAILLPK